MPSRKFLPYLIYTTKMDRDATYKFFARPFKPMEKRMMLIASICFVLHFTMLYLSGEGIL
jgi:hypothetical protein